MKHGTSLAKSFVSSQSGAVAIIFGMSAFVLFGLSFLALDMSRVFNTQQRVQAALDAAALAAAKMLDDQDVTDAEVHAKAQAYMNARLIEMRVDNAQTLNFQVAIDRSQFLVEVSTDVKVHSYFGNLADKTGYLQFTETAQVVYESKRVELAITVDISGSMSESGGSGGAKIVDLREAAEDIVEIMAATGPAKDAIRVGLVPFSASVNAGPFAAAATNPGGTDTCVVDRDGPHAYTDQPPGPGARAGKSSVAQNASYSCPVAEIQPLTDISDPAKKEDLLDKIRALETDSGTAGQIGTAWAWYMVSDNWSSFWPVNSKPNPKSESVIKAIILMTDGMSWLAYNNGGGPLAEPYNLNVAIPGSAAYQIAKLCDNMKSDDVVVFTVGFMTPPAEEVNLRNCSGDDNFYDANNGDELKEAFKEIGERLTSLRLTQ